MQGGGPEDEAGHWSMAGRGMDSWWMESWGMNAWGMGWPMLAMIVVLALVVVASVVLVLLLRRAFKGDPARAIGGEAARRLQRRGRVDGPAPSRAPAAGPAAGNEAEAFVVIPDITGYTAFMQLSRLSLAHAQYAVTELLEAVIGAGEACLTAAKVEGDAVLLYAPRDGDAVSGAEVGDALGRQIAAFYRTRAELLAGNACPCQACRNVDRLDLKVVAHGGPLLRYALRGQEELSGLAVIVAHRLLKNSLDLPRYILVTDAIHDAVRPPIPGAARRHRETYADVGEVAAYVYTFEPPAAPAAAGLSAKSGDALRKAREALRGLRAPAA